ncbi:hypothetical protein OQH61_02780 [Helicobacter sp. MIT 21-1697]|uniref:hypothetical protein n=1 Tax=Helicobacter sp. MIT 21-1697 TaxID=2993733 RepID=UPI00224B1A25|nr:hypothetical protein [Helicobacter sp. MIT 21-1697]MCX2716656.1 hypothetical protein [Helicobacter sp. MIT 21-1697]
MRQVIFVSMLWLTIIFMNACSHHDSLQSFNTYYYGGNDEKAYKYAKEEAGTSGDVLWNLQAGISAFTSHQEDTLSLLEQGEILFSQYESEGLMGGIFGNVGSVLVNENLKTYRGNIYEGVMFNYYKALNAMSLGDYALARVEFNRANDRQRRAKDYFNKDIQKALRDSEKENASNEKLRNIDMSQSSANITSILDFQYSNLKNFNIYNGFINPAISYVSALFFMSENDYTKAIDLYKEAYGITHSQVINQDLAVINNRKMGDKSTYTWFIIEDGQGASLEEFSIDLPAYFVSSNVLHVGVSIPQMKEGISSANVYQAVSHQNQQAFKAFEVSNVDAVVANEFSKKLPFILSRAVTSSLLKAASQATLSSVGEKQFGDTGALLGSLIGAAYSAATNSADIRITTALPKRVLALQVPNKISNFTLQADSNTLYEINFSCTKSNEEDKKSKNVIVLCDKNDNILYLRLKGRFPTYQILKGEY